MRAAVLAALLAIVAPSPTPAAAGTLQINDHGTATATDTQVTDTRLATSMRLAAIYWGRLPNCADLPWRTLIRPDDQAPVAAARGECERWIDPAWLARAPRTNVCAVVIHEIGHNLGYKHSYAADRARVMQPGRIPAICRPRSRSVPADRRWCRHELATCAVAAPRLHAYVSRHPLATRRAPSVTG